MLAAGDHPWSQPTEVTEDWQDRWREDNGKACREDTGKAWKVAKARSQGQFLDSERAAENTPERLQKLLRLRPDFSPAASDATTKVLGCFSEGE